MNTKNIIILIIVTFIVSFSIGFISRPVTADINRDGKVDKLDYSIMMSQWTE